MEWLEKLRESAATIDPWSVSLLQNAAFIRCKTDRDPMRIYCAWQKLDNPKGHVFIGSDTSNGRILAQSLEPAVEMGRTMRESKQPRSFFSQMQNHLSTIQASSPIEAFGLSKRQDCTISFHSRTEGFPYVAVFPYLGIEEILNKPVAELVGRPISAIDSHLAEMRLWCLNAADRTLSPKEIHYSHQWMGAQWQKRSTAYVWEKNPDLIVVETHCAEDWQRGYWANFVATPKQR